MASAPALVEQRDELGDQLDPLPVDQEQVDDAIRRAVERFGSLLVSLPRHIVSVVAEILLVFAFSAYLIVAGPALHRFMLSLLPDARRERAAAVLQEMGSTMGGYVRAEVITATIVGTITYVALLIIGVDYPLVLALIAALGELVPIAGPIISAVPALAVAFLDPPTQGLIVLGFFVALQQLESSILLPLIMRKQADIPPLLTLFALTAGATLGGIFGALLAIPLAGALRVLVLRVVAPEIRGWTGAAAEARKKAVPPIPGLSNRDA